MCWRRLRACGVDLSFTPVLDLDYGASSVIGSRAFHSDARVVSLLAKSLMHGLLRAGMGNCGKHFPGHGYVKADSHTAVPVDKRSLKAILADDARPYEWLSTTLTGVMPAHVVYPKVDSRPAGFSERWLKEILRGQMGFHRRHLQRRPQHGRRAPPRRQHAHLCRSRLPGAERRLRHGAAVQPERGRRRGVDELLAGLAQAVADGHWHPDPDSEQRRRCCCRRQLPLAWDDLMHDPVYQRALERLP
jgi:beta-N-acetylhexosaminidase